jgi:hypothetical protein
MPDVSVAKGFAEEAASTASDIGEMVDYDSSTAVRELCGHVWSMALAIDSLAKAVTALAEAVEPLGGS